MSHRRSADVVLSIPIVSSDRRVDHCAANACLHGGGCAASSNARQVVTHSFLSYHHHLSHKLIHKSEKVTDWAQRCTRRSGPWGRTLPRVLARSMGMLVLLQELKPRRISRTHIHQLLLESFRQLAHSSRRSLQTLVHLA